MLTGEVPFKGLAQVVILNEVQHGHHATHLGLERIKGEFAHAAKLIKVCLANGRIIRILKFNRQLCMQFIACMHIPAVPLAACMMNAIFLDAYVYLSCMSMHYYVDVGCDVLFVVYRLFTIKLHQGVV